MALDSQDNVFITGYAMIGAEGKQALTMKINGTNGNVVWSDTFGGSASDHDLSWDIVVGSDDNPIVSGVIKDTGEIAKYFVRKMQNSNGNIIWDERGTDTQFNPDSRGTWLDILPNDDVVMVQRVFGDNGYDVFLKRFANDDGQAQWSRLYDGATHGGDDPRGLTIDSDGNILVCGVQDILWNYDFMALKIDGSNGNTIWDSNYNGPPGWYDVAGSICEGPDGSVIVAGLSDGTGTGWDWATVAFDGESGDQLWFKRMDGPTSQSDEPNHVIASSSGEIFVTGYGYGEGSNKDMITVCYQVETTSAVGDTPMLASFTKAWPNPFNPRITFSFDLPRRDQARLAIYDLRGRQVNTLIEGNLSEGTHTTSWDGRNEIGQNMPAGVYLAIMESGSYRSSRKIVLAK
ncbi:MAG: T9SS type A sorting domain-containing protein [bacterium]|nr:T9SS type A sorting domain-containing protein [bacterium]